MTLVADTDVISFVFKRDSRARVFEEHLSRGIVAISFMTLAELHRWAAERAWGPRRRAELDSYLLRFTVQHSTEELCRWWAAVMVGARQAGRRIEGADAWIAATALWYDVPLLTHNPDDYQGVPGLRLIPV